MYRNKTFLAIIPARSGSKELSDKNIKDLLGKPLVAWSINEAVKSKFIDKLIVSTDSKKYRAIAQRYGANVPFIRPKKLATDKSPSFDLIKHAIDFFNDCQESFDYVILLQPTSPLRECIDIDTAIAKIVAHPSATALVSIHKQTHTHPEYLFRWNSSADIIQPYLKNPPMQRRQDFEELYSLNGLLFISQIDELLSRKTFFHAKTLGYPVPRWKSFEIDDAVDFLCVDALLRARKEQKI